MAKKRPLLDGIFQPQTMALLRTYAQYAKEIDGLDMSLVELAETLVLAHLEEHERFQDWTERTIVIEGFLERLGESLI